MRASPFSINCERLQQNQGMSNKERMKQALDYDIISEKSGKQE